MNDGLFDPEPYAISESAEVPGISPDRRRTLKRDALLARGIHPATCVPLLGNGETCKSCAHSEKWGDWWKCNLVLRTAGPGTDIRVGWPACQRWSPVHEEASA